MPASPRLLIVTAAFGEGHNSAANNLGLALRAAGAEVKVCDPCMLAAPYATGLIAATYRYITTHFPKLWERVYDRLTSRFQSPAAASDAEAGAIFDESDRGFPACGDHQYVSDLPVFRGATFRELVEMFLFSRW